MCELLGISSKSEVKINTPLLNSFFKRGKLGAEKEPRDIDNPHNPDGWGLAVYPDKAAMIIKEPIISSESVLAKNIST
ncbi:MAG: class II glutamine amidotransferase, partial [Nanoarchaeota archaeon]|nr:class II glutamine amidotransferase [Nanoarchaeota archaeon]